MAVTQANWKDENGRYCITFDGVGFSFETEEEGIAFILGESDGQEGEPLDTR